MNYVDATSPGFRAVLAGFASTLTYVLADRTTIGTIRAYARGVTADDAFPEALQQDMLVVADAPYFTVTMGQDTPRHLDRVRLPSGTYTVETWRASPASGTPVLFKLLVRGGQQ